MGGGGGGIEKVIRDGGLFQILKHRFHLKIV